MGYLLLHVVDACNMGRCANRAAQDCHSLGIETTLNFSTENKRRKTTATASNSRYFKIESQIQPEIQQTLHETFV
tara:strand:+ start:284 stop:508 length:225 start_codon:yes stop_codon:yes gene_type:complete